MTNSYEQGSIGALDYALAPFGIVLDAVPSKHAALDDRAPNAALYRVAIRRQGRALGEIGGGIALRRAVMHVAEMAPERSLVREAVIDVVWTGLPG